MPALNGHISRELAWLVHCDGATGNKIVSGESNSADEQSSASGSYNPRPNPGLLGHWVVKEHQHIKVGSLREQIPVGDPL